MFIFRFDVVEQTNGAIIRLLGSSEDAPGEGRVILVF